MTSFINSISFQLNLMTVLNSVFQIDAFCISLKSLNRSFDAKNSLWKINSYILHNIISLSRKISWILQVYFHKQVSCLLIQIHRIASFFLYTKYIIMGWSSWYCDHFSLIFQNDSFSRAKGAQFIWNRTMTLTSITVYYSVKQRISFFSCPKTRVAFISRIGIRRSVSFTLWACDVFLINHPFLNPEHRLLHIYIDRNPHIHPFSV